MQQYLALFDDDIVGCLKRELPLCEINRWHKLISEDNEYGAMAARTPDGCLCFEPEWVGDRRSVIIPLAPKTTLHSHPRKYHDAFVGPSKNDICLCHARGRCWQLLVARPGLFVYRFCITFADDIFAAIYGGQCLCWYMNLLYACQALDTIDVARQEEARRELKGVCKQYPGFEIIFLPWHELIECCKM
jgi:hypothetical protein